MAHVRIHYTHTLMCTQGVPAWQKRQKRTHRERQTERERWRVSSPSSAAGALLVYYYEQRVLLSTCGAGVCVCPVSVCVCLTRRVPWTCVHFAGSSLLSHIWNILLISHFLLVLVVSLSLCVCVHVCWLVYVLCVRLVLWLFACVAGLFIKFMFFMRVCGASQAEA